LAMSCDDSIRFTDPSGDWRSVVSPQNLNFRRESWYSLQVQGDSREEKLIAFFFCNFKISLLKLLLDSMRGDLPELWSEWFMVMARNIPWSAHRLSNWLLLQFLNFSSSSDMTNCYNVRLFFQAIGDAISTHPNVFESVLCSSWYDVKIRRWKAPVCDFLSSIPWFLGEYRLCFLVYYAFKMKEKSWSIHVLFKDRLNYFSKWFLIKNVNYKKYLPSWLPGVTCASNDSTR
jgi:hypothetical protein